MRMIDWIVNGVNAAIGRHQEFEQLMEAKDVSRAIGQMTDNSARVAEALKMYDTKQHSVNERADKAVFGKKDPVTKKRKFLRWEEKWKIPIPYPVYINEMALVFLYGRPLKWIQATKDTDRAYQAFMDLIQETQFNARIREAKRLAGAEEQSAMIFHTYRDDENKPKCLIKVVAKSLGDDLYFRKNQFNQLMSFARGYSLQVAGGEIIYHVDVYTKKTIYHCKRQNLTWQVEKEPNIVGKIPVILFEQERECEGVEPMINRKEWMVSRRADVNDRFSDPALVADSDIVNSLPEKGEDSKLYILKPTVDGSKKPELKYLTWDNAPESQRLESEELDEKIHRFSFTPKVDAENIKGLSNISAKALKQLMLLAVIKSEKHKEKHDDYAKRIGSVFKAIIGNVLDISLKEECKRMKLLHEFQEPFGEDVEAVLANLVTTKNAGGMSEETFIEMNPIIKDPEMEKARLQKEHEQRLKEEQERYKMDVFGNAE